MTKWNRKQPTWAGRTIIPDQFIIWIDPGVVGEMRTVASALRAGEPLAVDWLDRIFRDITNALLQSEVMSGSNTSSLDEAAPKMARRPGLRHLAHSGTGE
jgi:hypothetical protein